VAGLEGLGRLLVACGLGLAVLGAALWLGGHLGALGHLPGDIVVRRGRSTLYAPLGICLLISVVLTVVLNLLLRR
jgi:hypothetical protein